MAFVSTYLNFSRESEEAFNFYAKVFGTEIMGIMRHGDVPGEGENLSDEDKQLVINIALPILGGHMLMASDMPESMGFPLVIGTNSYISLHPDSKEEADRLFNELSAGGTIQQAMADMFWGDYWGAFTDKFGIQWMINYHAETE